MATNDYLRGLAGGGRQQITKLSDLASDESAELTVAQLTQIIAEIDVDLINIRRGRRGRFDGYSIGGSGGRTIRPMEGIETLLKLRAMYEKLLNESPAIAVTIYDDPDI